MPLGISISRVHSTICSWSASEYSSGLRPNMLTHTNHPMNAATRVNRPTSHSRCATTPTANTARTAHGSSIQKNSENRPPNACSAHEPNSTASVEK